MRAAFCTAPGSFELRDVARPEPGPGEVLIRVRHCGICGSDLHWYGGATRPPQLCPGHEIAGEIAQLGEDVEGWREGDRVVVEPLYRCGQCADCQAGNYQLCRRLQVLGMMRDGGFAEGVVAPAYGLFAVPEGLDLTTAALAEPTAVCVHALGLANLSKGQSVLVLGAGTIGLLAILAARQAGAGEIAITARHPHQAAAARALGATQVFSADAVGADQRRQWSSKTPVAAVIETVGGEANTLDEAVESVAPGGTVVVLGIFSDRPRIDPIALVVKEVRLIGSMTYNRRGARSDFEHALAILSAERDLVASLITHRFSLTDVKAGFDAAFDKRSGAIKVLIEP